jgi:hypothetical protein
MMKIAFRVIFIFKMAADKIGKISMFSNFTENLYLRLFWSEEIIGNDENCIQGHFYDSTVSKMAANKIDKLLIVSDFNENWYPGVFWSEKLVDNDEICIQGHFYEATIFKMAANKIVKLSMVSDFNENWYLGSILKWGIGWLWWNLHPHARILIWGSFWDFCVCIQTQSNLVIIIIIIIILFILLSFFGTWTCPRQTSGTTGQNFMKLGGVIDIFF